MSNTSQTNADSGNAEHSELLILPDGRVLVHNLTPIFADLLRELNPDDKQIASRTAHTPKQRRERRVRKISNRTT